ncbi:putative uncharacterized protein [Parachlamydia acanthamoebae UV-7]|jgi:peptide chain release factor 2|uniref:Prokaryotic-type class I peptide chain release factors domain-containing protein n=2 Tax=Parachlamydia acanthamoebae TaxID=83552 RepID=F8L0F8_PARAV|nr:peptide chain release factor-like protein [Parachlamydia acanthamoebae]EFB41664.1 hypothetical protein pah_c026o105 [Parachlamydia acanthamoebae str. Hall's coccus]KIA77606.1 hypothetical protein DB43_GD00370 [Parachlamydia acanthamoebae]CCB86693.1 putative uncharacterized protein [Parachlamydia acanthamoebae UV-7]
MAKIFLPPLDDDLLKECTMTAFRARGSGGQHVNVTDSAVRLTHNPTGIVITCQVHRSQHLNKKECLVKLREEVERRNYRKPKRVPTRIPHAVVQKNKAKKVKDSEKKKLRSLPPQENE